MTNITKKKDIMFRSKTFEEWVMEDYKSSMAQLIYRSKTIRKQLEEEKKEKSNKSAFGFYIGDDVYG